MHEQKLAASEQEAGEIGKIEKQFCRELKKAQKKDHRFGLTGQIEKTGVSENDLYKINRRLMPKSKTNTKAKVFFPRGICSSLF